MSAQKERSERMELQWGAREARTNLIIQGFNLKITDSRPVSLDPARDSRFLLMPSPQGSDDGSSGQFLPWHTWIELLALHWLLWAFRERTSG